MIRRLFGRFTAHIDLTLLTITGLLVALGLLALFSSANGSIARLTNQLTNLGWAIAAMWVVAKVSPQALMRIAPPLYLLGLALLIGVALFGEVVNGARRWLDVGVARIQPAEIMKLAMPMTLAWYFHRREAALDVGDFIVAAAILAVPVWLVARQPDLGTALLIAAAGGFVLFLAGLSWKFMVAAAFVLAASTPLVWGMLHDYQRQRIETLFDPSSDPLGAGYHILQSTIAVGSGGIFGKGWLRGTQTHLEFIPERSTDFIFAVFAEEFGLIGAALLLLLYLGLAARGMIIALAAPTVFARLLAGALSLTFFTYAFVNMGMVSGILPVVGVPLPFISYGGTALVTLWIGIGILMSIHKHRQLVQT